MGKKLFVVTALVVGAVLAVAWRFRRGRAVKHAAY